MVRLLTLVALAGVLSVAPELCAQEPNSGGPLPTPRVLLGVFAEPTAANADHVGVRVMEVTPDSPAAKAGLERGDVISKIGEVDVRNIRDFFRALAEHKAGDKVKLEVFRGGKAQNMNVTFAERQARPGDAPRERPAFLGIDSAELTPAVKQRLGVSVDTGVVVADVMPNTPAAKAGLQRGDVVTAVNGKDVANPEELRQAIRAAGAGQELTMKVARGKETREVKAKLEAAGAPSIMPPMRERSNPLETMDRRINELEKRVQDLEKRLKDKEK